MGKGNPSLKSFDNDRYEPVTYFIDLSSDEPDDDTACLLEDEAFDEFLSYLHNDLNHSESDALKEKPELSSSFRESGMILSEGVSCYVITETGNDYSHFPFAIIPNFIFENILDEIMWEHDSEKGIYETQIVTYEDAMEKLAETKYANKIFEFAAEAKIILEFLKTKYKIRERNGAWTSSLIN